jgi:copper chaperone CopZ
MKKESYLVEGMSCSGCERAIQKAVTSLPGVIKVQATAAESTVSVEYDPAKTSIGAIRDTIGKLGYKFVAERPALGQREGSDEAIA